MLFLFQPLQWKGKLKYHSSSSFINTKVGLLVDILYMYLMVVATTTLMWQLYRNGGWGEAFVVQSDHLLRHHATLLPAAC